ncbi:hypothetical protein [Mucilaginibacter terrae]|uniref:Uncharacterized protein n=1 Tax=Mucilaginibacter terrae TaxID=1955052 RepID=A0ABU3GNH5_9SPHI|nr:hypothetical protein [Mucilaginibacter terrae]MDT3401343.1 hypothetical protein [Mucilaginibacter terrae]
MMITYFDFLQMSEPEQFEAVWKGTFLGERREKGLWVQCYSLNSFYADVYYDETANCIQRVVPHLKIEQLMLYQ